VSKGFCSRNTGRTINPPLADEYILIDNTFGTEDDNLSRKKFYFIGVLQGKVCFFHKAPGEI